MNTLRTFIAVDLTPGIRAQLETLSARLRRQPGQEGMRFVAASGIHLTLKFLGDITPETAAQAGRLLLETASRIPPFQVGVRGIGCFPNARQPRVLWVGLEDPSGMLRPLHRAVEEGCARLNLPPEDRPFSPHLTIGRVRRDAGAVAGGFVRAALDTEQGLDLGPLPVEAVHLFRSELRPSGAVYSSLHSATLRGGP